MTAATKFSPAAIMVPSRKSPFRQTIAAGMALGLVDHAARHGADRAALLAMLGLETGSDPNRRVPLDLYAATLREAARQCGRPALAIEFSASSDFADLSIVGLIGPAAPTMREALAQLNRYSRLITDIAIAGPARFTLHEEADGLWLVDNRIDVPPFPELTESTLARMVAGVRRMGVRDYASAAQVCHTRGETAAALEQALGVPVSFGAPRNALRVNAAVQDHRLAQYPRYAFALFCAHADQLLDDLEARDSVAGSVERALLPILHSGSVSAATIARQLGYSEQGLYRALKAEGTSFEALLAGLRHRFALGYLEAGRTSLAEIAYLLGYSDVSAFARAFKRREGIAPGQWRRQSQQG
jgi:AraC-like DNA-binding protein